MPDIISSTNKVPSNILVSVGKAVSAHIMVERMHWSCALGGSLAQQDEGNVAVVLPEQFADLLDRFSRA